MRAIDQATVMYEISLRYYVLGLAAARSSYAYQSIGSTLCVDAPAYLSVRGFPKRAVGEDFYLLDKLAKVGPLRRISAEPRAASARGRRIACPSAPGAERRRSPKRARRGGEFRAVFAARVWSARGGDRGAR